jgi:hypothetical protein
VDSDVMLADGILRSDHLFSIPNDLFATSTFGRERIEYQRGKAGGGDRSGSMDRKKLAMTKRNGGRTHPPLDTRSPTPKSCSLNC